MTAAQAAALPGSSRSFGIDRAHAPDGRDVIALSGDIAFEDASALWNELTREGKPNVGEGQQQVDFDVSKLEGIDGGSMALLVHLRALLGQRGVRCEFVGASEPIQEVVRLYGGDVKPARLKKRRAQGMLDQIGAATLAVTSEVQRVLGFVGQLVIAGVQTVRRLSSVNWREVPHLAERCGADAVPIVLLLNLLVGMVMAFQSAAQLKQFGANLLVANLIGISVTRELGPLITAIVVAGRSGAAFAAELGTMRVNEEVDALRTMGLDPMRFLVIPRLLALIIVLPLLTFLADLVGIAGGLIVGMTTLDLSMAAYIIQTKHAVHLTDLMSGALKTLPFGLAIGLIACQQGLATEGGAEGVGRRTTSAVVMTLFGLVMLDAIFTVFFRAVNL